METPELYTEQQATEEQEHVIVIIVTVEIKRFVLAISQKFVLLLYLKFMDYESKKKVLRLNKIFVHF